jgi:putative transposase
VWFFLARRRGGVDQARPRLHPSPVASGADRVRRVNGAQAGAELEALRRSVARGRPYGPEAGVETGVGLLGLESSVRPRGRPRKHPDGVARSLGD